MKPPAKLTACQTKRRYPDEATARATGLYSLENNHAASALYVYRCIECRGWHLTRSRQGAAITAGDPFAEAIEH